MKSIHLSSFLAISLLCHFTPVVPDSCYNYGRDHSLTQTAFLFDRQYAESNNQYYSQYKNVVLQILKSSKSQVNAGVVSYGKFSKSSTSPDSCFRVENNFTTNSLNIEAAFEKMSANSDDSSGTSSPLSSAAFAAADQSLGWLHGFKSVKGLLLRRLVVFFSEHDDNLSYTGDITFQGDGSDTCAHRGPLNYASVRRTLRESHVAVLGLFNSPNLKRKYDLHFYALGVPYCSAAYDSDNFETVLKKSFDNCVTELQRCSSRDFVDDDDPNE